MGAYKIGEIKEICRMVLPDFGILTGINEQHLERFRKIENTIKAKFELIEAVNNDAKCLLNHDSKLVVDNYLKYIKKPNFYKAGDINFLNEELLGVANISNATASAKMAKIVGASSAIIKNKLSKLKPFSHRLEVKKLDNGWILLDDSYNSNVAGFKSALEALSNYKGTKIIATPGIVELGHLSNSIHLELGNYCDKICDFIILVGKSSRTEFLSRGVENKYKIIRIDSINSLNKTVENLGVKFPIILIENDLTDNY
jgi:UDP-N-acetylmuramoyl-tripeptide--D-alanyl-D-alanine ligase